MNECYYCGKKPDGAMFTMGKQMAHANCVITKLNELLDPDYDGTAPPEEIVGYLTVYVKLAEDQSHGGTPELVYACQHNWRRVEL